MCSKLFDFVLNKKSHKTYVTCLLGRLYQNIDPLVTRKPCRVMSPSAFGIACNNPQDLSCHLGTDILVCHPLSHVMFALCRPVKKKFITTNNLIFCFYSILMSQTAIYFCQFDIVQVDMLIC